MFAISPKCNLINELTGELIPCSPEELSEFDTLFNSDVPGIAFEVFSLELQLDYTDFEKPLKLK
jgi:hypothetical protein